MPSFMGKFAYLSLGSYYLMATANIVFMSRKVYLINLLYQGKEVKYATSKYDWCPNLICSLNKIML